MDTRQAPSAPSRPALSCFPLAFPASGSKKPDTTEARDAMRQSSSGWQIHWITRTRGPLPHSTARVGDGDPRRGNRGTREDESRESSRPTYEPFDLQQQFHGDRNKSQRLHHHWTDQGDQEPPQSPRSFHNGSGASTARATPSDSQISATSWRTRTSLARTILSTCSDRGPRGGATGGGEAVARD